MKRCADAFVPSEAVNVLIVRVMCTDKMETERGARTYVEVPLQAKCRIVVQGPRETLGETEQRDTSSPTLPEEAPHVFFTIAVSMGWIVQQGDVEAAFLNGLRLDRELILQASREGLPAIPGVMEAVPGAKLSRASTASTTRRTSGAVVTPMACWKMELLRAPWRLVRCSGGLTGGTASTSEFRSLAWSVPTSTTTSLLATSGGRYMCFRHYARPSHIQSGKTVSHHTFTLVAE